MMTLSIKYRYLLLFVCLMSYSLNAQVKGVKYSLNKIKKDSLAGSEKQIIKALALKQSQDKYWIRHSDLGKLQKKWISENELSGMVDGYRVQIGVGSNDSIKEWNLNFIEKYPDIKTYMIFDAPSFKLRVGNFYGAWAFWEANILANELKKDYNSAIYVREKIRIEDLKEENEAER